MKSSQPLSNNLCSAELRRHDLTEDSIDWQMESFGHPASQTRSSAFIQMWSSLRLFHSCCPHLENGSSKVSFKGSCEMKWDHAYACSKSSSINVSFFPFPLPVPQPYPDCKSQKKVRQQKRTLLAQIFGLALEIQHLFLFHPCSWTPLFVWMILLPNFMKPTHEDSWCLLD